MSVAATSMIQIAPRKRRNTELVLVLLACAIGLAAYVIISVDIYGTIPPSLASYAAGVLGMALVAHVVVRFRAPYADPLLLPCTVLLNSLGLAMIHRLDIASTITATTNGFTPKAAAAPVQMTWTAVGLVGFIVLLFVVRDHRALQRWTYTIGLVGVLLLLLPLVPGIGRNINGSRIWIGVAGFSFQPGEVAKILLVLAFSGYLVVKRDVLALAGHHILGLALPRARDLGPILFIWLISLGILVFQNDLGSSLLFFSIFLVLLYVATERPGWIIVGGLLFVVGAYAATKLIAHVGVRVDTWLHVFTAPLGYQVKLSLFGLANGGILGTGWGLGHPELTPVSKSDFIGAAFGEELGLVGMIALLMVYLIIAERGLRTALACTDTFGKLVATGLAMSFIIQVFVVVGGVTRLIPLTGLTTPFMSLGGSSLVANWVIMGILLRISDRARRPQTRPGPVSDETIMMAVSR